MAGQHDPAKQRDQWLFLGTTSFLFLALVVGLAREQRWGQRFRDVELVATTATGLRTGVDVRISGIPVGQVVSMEMQPDARVRIRLHIAERYQRLIGPRSVATQGVDGFVGDHFIAISPDPQSKSASSASGTPAVLPYTQPIDVINLMEKLVETQVSLQSTLRLISGLAAKNVPEALVDLRSALTGVHQLSTSVDSEIKTMGPQLRQTLQTIDRTGDGASSLIQSTSPVLAPTLKEIQSFAGSANRLLQMLLGSGWLEPADTRQPQQSLR